MCVHVVATPPILQYIKRNGTKASMFTAAVADQKTAAIVIVYDASKTTNIYESAKSWQWTSCTETGIQQYIYMRLRLSYCFTPYQRLWLYNGAP